MSTIKEMEWNIALEMTRLHREGHQEGRVGEREHGRTMARDQRRDSVKEGRSQAEHIGPTYTKAVY